MKLIFLVALVYLAAEWPTPSVCWPMSQQYGSMDTSPLSSIIEHPAVKALQEASNIEEFQVPGHASYVEPFATQQQQSYGENVRMLNGRQSNRMHHQQHQQHNRMHQQQQEHQQAYDQFFTNEFIPQQKQQQAAAANVNKPMKFKMAKPDNVHNVGIDTITDEMSRVLSMRKDDQQKDQSDSNNKNNNNNNGGSYAQRNGYNPYNSQFPTYGRNFGGNAGYATNSPSYVPNIPSASTYMPNTDQLAQAFSSLIIIVNSNANSNLGVTLIDIDLFRSFLSQFASKSVDEVLKDGSLENKINDFNKERERTLSASTNGKNAEKGKKNESVSKLSANVPSYSNDPAQPIDSHSESTVLLNRKGGYNNGYASSNPYTYSYVPYQSGGLIVVNNVNDNYNKVVKSVLSGKGTNIGKNDAFVLPLPPNEITRLMEDAVIVNNDNKNTNIN